MTDDYAIVFAMLLAAALFWLWARRQITPTERVKLPVVKPETPKTCATCAHFDLTAGKRIIEANPAFLAATQHLQPWQMSRTPANSDHKEYFELEREMIRAGEEGRLDEQRELHAKLLALHEALEPTEPVELSPQLISLGWEDFGACTRHKELRARTDHCEEYTHALR